MLGWLPEVRAETISLVRTLPLARALPGLRFEPQRWGPGVFRLAAPGGSHLLVRRHGAPELAFWLPAKLAPRVGEPFGFYLPAGVRSFDHVRIAGRLVRRVGHSTVLRSAPYGDADRQVAMLYVYDALRAGVPLREIGSTLLEPMPVDWRSSSERSDLRRLAEAGEKLVAGGYRSLLNPALRRSDHA